MSTTGAPSSKYGPPVTGELIGGKFRVEEPLGEGGMGTVYVAMQEPLGRRVALKLIRHASLDAGARERFVREARMVAQLRSPHVVTLHDFGEHEGALYIAMELLPGETLRKRLSRGPIAEAEALAIARDVACGLRAAHEAGIVHRDVKPENIVLVPDADRGVIAKLLDFGVARLDASPDATQTAVGVVVGTPGYIAPETALHGRTDDPRSDLYSLGVTLYEALCGCPPFTAATAIGLVMMHATEAPPDPRTRNASISDPAARLVLDLLSKDADARPADGGALVVELDRLRGATMPTGTPQAPLARRSLPARPSIAVQPFAATGGSEEDVLFGECIGEDVLVALSSFKQLFVVAQSSMWKSGGRDTDALRVGRTLDVQFVLQGSVRRAKDRLRVNVSLVDSVSGAQVWAQRFDRDVADVFAVEDEVVQAIVACVAGRVEQAHAEASFRKPPQVLQAYEWLARGRAHHHRYTAEDNLRSREALEKAVELDPEYAQAHAWRACAYGQAMYLTGDFAGWMPQFLDALGRALALDEGDSECHRLACELAMIEDDLAKAEHHHTRAIGLNPNDARIVGQRGELALYMGRFEEAQEALQCAMRLDPLGPKPYLRHLARTYYMRDQLPEAWSALKGLDQGKGEVAALTAAVAALRGDSASVAAATARLREMPLTFSVEKSMPHFASEELRTQWRRGFVAAGLTP